MSIFGNDAVPSVGGVGVDTIAQLISQFAVDPTTSAGRLVAITAGNTTDGLGNVIAVAGASFTIPASTSQYICLTPLGALVMEAAITPGNLALWQFTANTTSITQATDLRYNFSGVPTVAAFLTVGGMDYFTLPITTAANNAAASAAAALGSQTAAGVSAAAALVSENNATAQALAAGVSATAANGSAVAAAASAVTAGNAAVQTAADVVSAQAAQVAAGLSAAAAAGSEAGVAANAAAAQLARTDAENFAVGANASAVAAATSATTALVAETNTTALMNVAANLALGDLGSYVHMATVKAVPVTADEFMLLDSAAGFATRKLSFSQLATAVIGSLNTDVANFLNNPTSANLAAAVTDETGTAGNVVFSKNATMDALTQTGKSLVQDARFAAVSATLPALSYVAACFHLAKDDTDKGAWRKRKGQSWRSEARSAGKYLGSYVNLAAAIAAGGTIGDVYYTTTGANFQEITSPTTTTQTYRAGREDYPTNALITVEAGRLIIWDLDTAIPSMWGVMVTTANYWLGGTAAVSSVDARNCWIIVGYSATSGVNFYDMASDVAYGKSTVDFRRTLPWSGRNTAGSTYNVGTQLLASAAVTRVAITVQEGAPYLENGLPAPTFVADTALGISAWQFGGSVWDITYGGLAHSGLAIDKNNRIVASLTATSQVYTIAIPTADNTANPPTGANVFDQTAAPACFNVAAKQVATGGGMIALGSSSGLELLVDNVATKTSGLRAAISSVYNTGWLVGDIRRCFLANSTTLDRSVKAGTLAVVGAPTETVIAGGRNRYTGFSAANYFQEASHADWNALGTGDFYFAMSGVKWGTAATIRTMFTLGDGVSAGSVRAVIGTSGAILFQIYTGAAFSTIFTSATLFSDTGEHFVEFLRTTISGVASTIQVRVDGVVIASAVSALTISNATGFLRIGESQHASTPWVGGQVSCFRISATAPSIEASRAIAAMENALNGGNACLLSNSDTVSRIAYDKDTGEWVIGNGTNIDTFAGLKRIASSAHGVTTLTATAAANGRTLIVGTGATYTAPERNISAELNEAMHREPRRENYTFTTGAAATTQSVKQGWKAVGMLYNATDNTWLKPSGAGAYTQAPDGFVQVLGGLTASKEYHATIEEII